MPVITVERLDEDEILSRGIRGWPIWTRDVSRFDWHYDAEEQCLLLEGSVSVETDDGTVTIGAGDFVIFPAGLACTWDIHEPVCKHYRLGEAADEKI